MQADDVALAEERVEVDAGRIAAALPAVMDHSHAEGPPHRGHPATDPPMTHDAERAAGEFHEFAVPVTEIVAGGPVALVHGAVVVAHAVGQFEDHRPGGLHNVRRAVFRNIADRDAALAGRGHVHDVEARRQNAHIPQPR